MLTDLPNLLTLGRIGAIPVVVALIAVGRPWASVAACALFAAASVTDLLDGMIARRRGLTSDLGRMLDPIADKLLVAAALVMLAATGGLGSAWLGAVGLVAALLILLRELLVSGLREFLAERRIGLPVSRLAKWKTAAQMAALGVLLLGDGGAAALLGRARPVDGVAMAGVGLLAVAAVLTIATGRTYLAAALHHAITPRARPVGRGGPGHVSGPAAPVGPD